MQPDLHLHFLLHPLWNTKDIYLQSQKTNSNSLKVKYISLFIWTSGDWADFHLRPMQQYYQGSFHWPHALDDSARHLGICAIFFVCIVFSVLIIFSNEVFTLQNFNDCRPKDETMHKLREMLCCYRRSETFHRYRCQCASSHSVTIHYKMDGKSSMCCRFKPCY